jgi:hypothetical protein
MLSKARTTGIFWSKSAVLKWSSISFAPLNIHQNYQSLPPNWWLTQRHSTMKTTTNPHIGKNIVWLIPNSVLFEYW